MFAAYICRGIAPEEARELYPDLDPLFQDMNVGPESALDDLLSEVAAFLRAQQAETTLVRTWRGFRMLLAFIVGTVGLVARPWYWISYGAGAWGWYDLTTGTVPLSPSLYSGRIYLLLLAAGTSVVRVPTLDLHPFLWNETRDVTSRHWHLRALAWSTFVRAHAHGTFLCFAFLTMPALALLMSATVSQRILAGACFLSGVLLPTAVGWATRSQRRLRYQREGMVEREMRRIEGQRPFGRRLSQTPQFSSASVQRDWLPRPPRVFISYSRADEAERPIVMQLAQDLRLLGVPTFVDVLSIRTVFTSWRANVVAALLDCTHYVLILGSNAARSRPVKNEIRTALHRWETEVYPVVICVADDDMVEKLLSDGRTLPVLKNLLRGCKRVSPAEVLHHGGADDIVDAGEYQGLLADWGTLLWPRGKLRRAVSSTPFASEWVGMASALKLGLLKELVRYGFVATVLCAAWDVADPSAPITHGSKGLLWSVRAEGGNLREAPTGTPPAPTAALTLISDVALLRLRHHPNSPSSSRFGRVNIVVRSPDIAITDITLVGDGGLELDLSRRSAFAPDTCRKPQPAGWTCASAPITLAPLPNRDAKDLTLRVGGRKGSTLELKEVTLALRASSGSGS